MSFNRFAPGCGCCREYYNFRGFQADGTPSWRGYHSQAKDTPDQRCRDIAVVGGGYFATVGESSVGSVSTRSWLKSWSPGRIRRWAALDVDRQENDPNNIGSSRTTNRCVDMDADRNVWLGGGWYETISGDAYTMAKFDDAGDLQWKYLHAGDVLRMGVDGDGNSYALIKLSGDSRQIVKLNASGTLQWSATARNSLACLDVDADGNQFVHRFTSLGDAVRSYTQNASGTIGVSSVLDDTPLPLQDGGGVSLNSCQTIRAYPGGGWIVVGQSGGSGVDPQCNVTRVASDGSTTWKRLIGNFRTRVTGVTIVSDGGIVVAVSRGVQSGFSTVLDSQSLDKLDPDDGSEIWSQDVPVESGQTFGEWWATVLDCDDQDRIYACGYGFDR